MTDEERKELDRLGRAMAKRAKSTRKSRRERLERRQRAEPFTEERGRAMWEFGYGRASVTTSAPAAAASQAACDLVAGILGRGPQSQGAIARRAVAAAMVLGLVDTRRAAKIAGCHPQTIRKIAKTLT